MPKELQKAKQLYRDNVTFPFRRFLNQAGQVADKRLYPLVAPKLPKVEVAPGSNESVDESYFDKQLDNVLASKAINMGQVPQGRDFQRIWNDQVDNPEIYLSAINAQNKDLITPGSQPRQFPMFQAAAGLGNLIDPLGNKGQGIAQMAFGLKHLLAPKLQTKWDPKYKHGKYSINEGKQIPFL